ncbi:glutamyl aminopeptidase-like [Diadema antillarum]|uniref:glutamyl aminopeptidase-like n=1 Tax=Diadema antillarum TaxID=105358 RepID=UPI003A8A1FE7
MIEDDFYQKSGGYFLRRSQLIAAGVLVACLCLMVGLLCGLLPQSQTCEVEAGDEVLVFNGDGMDEAGSPKWDQIPEDTPVEKANSNEWEELRLPENLIPHHYHLRLHPNLTTEDFTGHVEIEVEVTGDAPVMFPRLHIKAMTIYDVKITDEAGVEQTLDDPFFYEPNEFLVIPLMTGLNIGNYRIIIDFYGLLNETIVGFYKSVYQDADGTDRAIATSKFQPTDARRAFPCFDEPAFKARYTTSLVHPPDYFALSNMDENRTETYGNDLQITHFNPSVPMSSYLACFIVCQFDYREMNLTSGIPFRVYAPPDVIDQVEYSLRIGVNITEYYEYYFDIPYPLPKLDMIAIPDFSSGAMEHWGLITYRETNLLYDPLESANSNKQRVAAVVSHELAHMWFGNIVTCHWWDDLWLNEGFASYVEYLGVDQAEPTWKMMEQFVTSDLHYVMGLDQIVSSHPIIVEVNHPDEINEIFDSIPYSKGASVIRMMNNILGEDVFRAGVTNFLKNNIYSTAVSDDLWAELTNASIEANTSVDVKRVMDTWTLQMGFPVVTMNTNGNDLNGSQEWFLVDPSANKSADLYGSIFDYRWEIPLYHKFENDATERREWMLYDGGDFEYAKTGSEGNWLVVNTGRMGYYRVNYDTATWNSLSQQLEQLDTDIMSVERAGLIDDAFNLARANLLEYNIPLDMTKYLTREQEFVPWDTARDSLLWMGELMRFNPGYGLYRDYIENLTRGVFEDLGWTDTGSHLDRFLRSDIIDLACKHGNRECIDQAVSLFNDYLNGSYVSPNLRSDVFEFGMQKIGGQEEWNKLRLRYLQEDVSSERTRLLYAMAQTRIPWILSNYLDTLLSEDSFVRDQDFFSVIGYVGDNPVGNPIAWDWVRKNWPILVERFTVSDRYLGRVVPGLTEFYSTELQLQEMLDFFAEYPDGGAGARGRQQAIEKVRGNINWVERNADVVYEWLQQNAAA